MSEGLLDCPCCDFPTLSSRGGYEICAICWWEDDGQQDASTDEVWGGPNAEYSLARARQNFRDRGDMYDLGTRAGMLESPSRERQELLDYVRSVGDSRPKLNNAHLRRMVESVR